MLNTGVTSGTSSESADCIGGDAVGAQRGRGRPRDPHVDNRVLAAARELVGELGYHQVTMESIARRARVGKATLYRRWPNRASVITDAFADELAEPPTPDTGELRADVLAYLREIVETLTLLGDPSVVASALAERGQEGEAGLRDILRARRAPGLRMLQRWVVAGVLPESLPVDVVVDGWAGFLLYRIVFGRQVPGDGELGQLVDLLPRGD